MDFLEEYDISEDTINEMIDKNTEENIDNFIENEYNVREILSFLKQYKIPNIEQILISNISYFLRDLSSFKQLFNIQTNK